MITIIARMKIKEGKEDAALAALKKMAAAVEANEPSALAYACHRLQDDPSQVIFFELYADDDAFKSHMQTPHMGEMRAGFAELFDTSAFKIERCERIAGFIRAGPSQ